MDKETILAIDQLARTLGQHPKVIYLCFFIGLIIVVIITTNMVKYFLNRGDQKKLFELLGESIRVIQRNTVFLELLENYLRGR